MRNRLTAVAAGAFLFAAACGGGGGSSGATGAGTGTSGGAGATTGGTSTGKPLVDGVACSSNGECASQICGIDGTGNCCTMSCVTSDVSCGATACDQTGACLYPGTSAPCGSGFCGADKLTQQACNGAGACIVGSSNNCPMNLGCNAAGTACNTVCASSKDCAGQYVCNNGACVAPLVVGACTENDDCYSNPLRDQRRRPLLRWGRGLRHRRSDLWRHRL